ncbi:MAG: hypothetical protein LBM99_05120 [Bacillales bacterium]|jgi:predicted transcriptional regulator of viral defense system|nr:hypothetical protein [Bacillales bacterium]
MKNIEEVLKKLVFTTKEVAECHDKLSNVFYYLKSNVDRGKIAKLKKGLYALVNPVTNMIYADKYMIATRINDNSFVAYHSAFELYGMANQIFSTVYVASKVRFVDFEYDGILYKYIRYQVPSDIETIQSSIDILVTSYEQSLIDCVDRVDLAGGSEELLKIFDFCRRADANKLLLILQKYNNKTLYQKVGFLFEKSNNILSLPKSFFQECHKHIAKNIVYFLQDIGGEIKLNKKWNIIAPKDLRKI